jgi:ABC-type bacteriocin/lantibiotic exporter with double-glycine peptidase domain
MPESPRPPPSHETLARDLEDDFLRFLTPRLKASRTEAWTLDEVPPVLEALEKAEGRSVPHIPVLVLDAGPWGFVRSLVSRTPRQFRRTFAYMTVHGVLTGLVPLAVEMILTSHREGHQGASQGPFFLWLAILPLLVGGGALAFRRYMAAFTAARLMQKGALLRWILDRWLTLHPDERFRASQGEMQALLSTDTDAVSHFTECFADAFMVLIHLGIAGALLWRYLGHTALVSLCAMALIVPLVARLVKASRRRQREVLVRRDARLALTSQVLTAMKVVKLSGWEGVFHRRLAALRRAEVHGLLSLTRLDARSSLVYAGAGVVVATLSYQNQA